MSTILKINHILVTVLSITTGLFKLTFQEADIQLFQAIGMNATFTAVLGGVQLVGGILLIPKATRRRGALIMIPTFVLASIAVFANQMMIFGVVSLLFIVMALIVFKKEHSNS